jgi:hypothetical protein
MSKGHFFIHVMECVNKMFEIIKMSVSTEIMYLPSIETVRHRSVIGISICVTFQVCRCSV